MKAGLKATPSKEEWLAGKLPKGAKVGVDARLVAYEASQRMAEALRQPHGLELVLDEEPNLIDIVWGGQRPALDRRPIVPLDVKYAGRSSADKIAALRATLREQKRAGFLVSALDEVAWLFNLRGSDIPFNPLFFAYAIVLADEATPLRLYTDQSRIEMANAELAGVQLRPYDSVFADLRSMRAEGLWSVECKLMISGSSCNAALAMAAGGADVLALGRSPVEAEKAIKNDVEMEGFRQCHIRDAAALCSYFAWLEEQLATGAVLDEVDGADRLEAFRRAQPQCVGLSFDTISGSGPNGAIIHYKPERPGAARITTDRLYLCDSGGQYLDGTTDVTRTVHFGTPSDEERDRFTRVLKGNISLNLAVFPTGTTGLMLDTLARMPLWKLGLDYRHGTGHGVGHYLNVHEGPQNISFRPSSNETPLRPGMTITDEPGFYLDGQYGIRIENVLLVRPAQTPYNFGGVGYLTFENITMVPIQKKLIDTKLLNAEEIAWINEHHAQCWEKVGPLLEGAAKEWLRRETTAL